ncbi:MAG TPA: LuxR C-terminal-related transcriptional regulator [Terriglobales bacterium]|nr:LuxR C-terminal-related transcriptional regulator [Terriglobales bacterium]
MVLSKLYPDASNASFSMSVKANRLTDTKPNAYLVIVDSTRMGAQLLADALKRERFAIVYNGSNIEEAVMAASRSDVALLIAATDQQCSEACNLARRLRATSDRIKVILVTEEPRRETVIEAFRAGVRGIFSRTTSVTYLRRCILAVHAGQIWASNKDFSYAVEALGDPRSFRLVDARGIELLSRREEDVVRCVSEGLTNREIADRLDISENTVKNYLFRIFDKLGVSSRVELILYAVSNLAQQQETAAEAIRMPASDVEVLQSYQTAAEQLIAPTFSLGEIYRDGRGVPRDPASAYMWFLIAENVSADMNEKSRAAVASLHNELTDHQRWQAQEAAERWLKDRGYRSLLSEQQPTIPTRSAA